MAQLRISAVVPQCSKCSRTVFRQYSSSRDRYIHYSKVPTMHYQASLPRLPVPKLADSCSRYLKAVQPLVDDVQFQKTEKIVAGFQQQGGNGEMLQDRLITSDKNNKYTSYISGPWFDMYLEYRDRLVLNHNPFLVFKAIPELANQVDVAANLVWSSVRYRQALFDGVLAPEVFHLQPQKSDVDWFKNIIRFVPSRFAWYGAYLMNAFPLDMSQYNSLFNSTRLPRVGKDELVSYTDSTTTKHAVVFCRGHTYKLKCITDEGHPIPVAQLKQGLQEILSDTRPPPTHPVGYLTTMKRDPWANLREEMLPDNRESLEAIDSAVMVLCLDDKEPTTPEQVSRSMLYGDAANRWFDKSFSYIVSPSGLAALNFEHSWGDGVAIMGLVNAVYKENLTNPQVPATTETSSVPLVEKVDFNLPDSVKEGITKAKKDYEQVTGTLSINLFQSEVFGKNLVKKYKVSPDAIMQLVFQIAYYRLFKCSPATYESCSTAAFRHGRTETIRSATMATLACAKAFEKSHSASAEEMLEFIRKSSEYHFQLTKDAAMGQGFDRHLFALKSLCKRDGIEEPLFEDPSYAKLNHIIYSTSTLSSDSVRLGGFAPVNPDCYGIGYNIFDDSIGCHITTYPNCDGARLVEELNKVFNDLHTVLTGKSFK